MYRYWVRPLILIAAVALIAVVALIQHVQQGGTIYSVRQIVTGVRTDQSAWLGRVVLVRGTAVETEGQHEASQGLLDAGSTGGSDLPVVAGSPDPVYTLLRRIPPLQRFAPGMQVLEGAGVYRLRLDPLPCQAGEQPPCYVGTLLDAGPDGP
jgi:hypothetical protein